MDKWTEIEGKSIKNNIPLRGIIELNYACNFSCVYCYLGKRRKERAYLSSEKCAEIFPSLRKAGTLVLTFTGGEPFINPDFKEILRGARASRFAVRIFTNGSLINEEWADLLREIKPLSIDVSLYGAGPHTYKKITGNAENFNATVKGLGFLQKAGIAAIIKIVANKVNFSELPEMMRIAEKFDFETNMTPLITPTDCGDFSPCSYMLRGEDLKEYFKTWGKTISPVNRRHEEIVCTSGRNAFVISPAGDVYPCIQIREKVGNILETGFNHMWKEDPCSLLQHIRSLKFSDFKECCVCEYASCCFFCPGLALLESGSLTGKNVTACRFTKILIEKK